MTDTPSILDEAKAIIYGDREATYGDPGKNLTAIAAMWTAYIRSRYPGYVVTVTSEDVAALMMLLKVARLANTPGHRDSLVDLCGYAALTERIRG